MSRSITTTDLTTNRRKLSLYALALCHGLLLSGSGCRSTADNQIDLLERELRVQEDYIYELEGYVVDYSEKLRDCRGCSPSQTAAYSEEVYRPEPKPTRTKSKKPARQRSSSENGSSQKEKSIVEPIEDDLPAPGDQQTPEISPEDMEVPDIDLQLEDTTTNVDDDLPLQQVAALELGYESAGGEMLTIPDPVDYVEDDGLSAASRTGEITETADVDAFDAEQEIADELFAEDQPAEVASRSDRAPQRLEIKHLFRGAGEKSDPKNLLTVVEALDENNEPVDLDGEVALMIMTPDESGNLKRLKRWNFTSEETVAAWQSSDLGDGLHLELPLEKVNLPKTPIELWARLVTADGRKLLTQLPFEAMILSALDEGSSAPEDTALASTDAAAQSSDNPLRVATTRPIPADENLKLTKQEQAASQQGWRRSMQRTDRTSEGFATTSTTDSNGWTKQAPGRVQYQPAKVADRPEPASYRATSQPATKPVWTAGRTLHSAR